MILINWILTKTSVYLSHWTLSFKVCLWNRVAVFCLRNIHFLCAFTACMCWPRQTLGIIWEQISENPRPSRGFIFTYSRTITNFAKVFTSPIFRLNLQRERQYTKCVCIVISFMNCKFSQLGDSQCHRSRHFRALHAALWNSTYWPIKLHVLFKLFYKYVHKSCTTIS